MTHGNHELCDRAAQGWFRFLDTRNFPKAGAAYARTDEPEYDGTDGAAANFKYILAPALTWPKTAANTLILSRCCWVIFNWCWWMSA